MVGGSVHSDLPGLKLLSGPQVCSGHRHGLHRWIISRLSRNLDDEEWILIFASVKRSDVVGFMTLNLDHRTSFRSRIIAIAGEPISNEHRKTQRHNILCCPLDVHRLEKRCILG
jgi:hypothetical protein